MGTFWSVTCYSALDAAPIERAIRVEIDRTIALFSHWQGESEISRLNDAPGDNLALSAAFSGFLAEVLKLAALTGGAFDPGLGALVNLWGFGPPGARPPTAPLPLAAEIAGAHALSGWQRITLDPASRRLSRPPGLRLDFSGCAKGWAVDRVSAALTALGITSHMVEIGGEIAARGLKSDLQPWWITIERPSGATGAPLLVGLTDLAMASSGDYRHAFAYQDQRYAHTIDGASGWPVRNALASVTVLAGDAMRADALASALMVMGPSRAIAFASRHDLPAILFERHTGGLSEHLSPAFERMMHDA